MVTEWRLEKRKACAHRSLKCTVAEKRSWTPLVSDSRELSMATNAKILTMDVRTLKFAPSDWR